MLFLDSPLIFWNVIEGIVIITPLTLAIVAGIRNLKKSQKDAIKESAATAIAIVTNKYTLIEREVVLKLDSIKNVIDSIVERMDKLEEYTQNQIKEFRNEIKSLHEQYSKLSNDFNIHLVNSDNYIKMLNDMSISYFYNKFYILVIRCIFI